MPLNDTLPQRFWNKVRKTDTCWLWTAYTMPNGYGKVGRNGKVHLAHRVAYEMEHGPIPAGLQVDHLCRVRHCVRTSHMELVDQRTNLLRGVGVSARNAQKTHCPHGHAYDLFNTRYRSNGDRRCNQCQNERNARRYV